MEKQLATATGPLQEKRGWGSPRALAEGPFGQIAGKAVRYFIMPALAAQLFCCQPPTANADKDAGGGLPLDFPIGYVIKASVNGRDVRVDLVRTDWSDTTTVYYYKAYFGDGSGDSGKAAGVPAGDSALVKSLAHTYSATGAYTVSTSLCRNAAFDGASTASVQAIIQ